MLQLNRRINKKQIVEADIKEFGRKHRLIEGRESGKSVSSGFIVILRSLRKVWRVHAISAVL